MRHFHLDELPATLSYNDGQFYKKCDVGSTLSNAYWSVVEPFKPAIENPDFHDCDQWLYVISGSGRAESGSEQPKPLTAGSLLMIPAGKRHLIINNGPDLLVTVNVFALPLKE